MADQSIPASPTDAYVYAIIVDGVARYIGKGSGIPLKRAREHMRTIRRITRRRASGEKVWTSLFHHRLIKAWESGAVVEEMVLAEGLTHDDAFQLEVAEIAKRDNGELWNGDGGGLGAGRITDETRAKQSKSAKRRAATPEGRLHLTNASKNSQTLERREQSRRTLMQRFADPEERSRHAETQRARWLDEERAARMREGLSKGRRAPHTAERMAKIWVDPATRIKASASHKAAWIRRKARQT